MAPEDTEAFLKWQAGINYRVATMAAQQRRISELYTYLAAAYDGQDFPEVYSHGINVGEFIDNVNKFRLEARNDNQKFNTYLNEINKLQLALETSRKIDDGLAAKYGVSIKEYYEKHASTEITQVNEYLKATGKAQALHLNAMVGYLERFDEQAKELLDGWARVEKNAQRELTVGAILNVVDILTGIGIGVAGGIFLAVGRPIMIENKVFDAQEKIWKKTGELIPNPRLLPVSNFWDIGTNGGDVVDMVSVALSTYSFYDNINRLGINKKSSDVLEWIDDKIKNITGNGGNFDTLVKNLKARVASMNEQEEGSPNPFIPL